MWYFLYNFLGTFIFMTCMVSFVNVLVQTCQVSLGTDKCMYVNDRKQIYTEILTHPCWIFFWQNVKICYIINKFYMEMFIIF